MLQKTITKTELPQNANRVNLNGWLGIRLLMIIVLVSVVGCDKPPDQKETYRGKHLLRQAYTREQIKSNISGSFFLGIGGISGGTYSANELIVWWKWKDGSYICNKINAEKARIINEEVEQPYITFELIPTEDGNDFGTGQPTNPQKLIATDYKLEYATIHIKENDFPLYIAMTPKQ